ncbi:hypothetical protein [Streptomyces sp. MZ04]|uniref:hypothetical protein n=1 Tax=Streptomyces sp. MZ04 TaxID=2559236 RepID=UPI00107E6E3B|nr:hypothetical protein [Streptomyces sp. MZ04]TGB11593.1 hypothetical protein E2651_13010 [Streptomyces sp. MZ04]
MATVMESRPLADLEEESLIAVEQEWGRRAHGLKPWTTEEYLDHVVKVHARYANFRRWQEKQAAS